MMNNKFIMRQSDPALKFSTIKAVKRVLLTKWGPKRFLLTKCGPYYITVVPAYFAGIIIITSSAMFAYL